MGRSSENAPQQYAQTRMGLCEHCGGDHWLDKQPCPVCNPSGTVSPP